MNKENINVHVHLANTDELQRIDKQLNELTTLGAKIMDAIKNFADQQKQFQDAMQSSLDGLQGDLQSMNDEIIKLQNSAASVLSNEDAASLQAVSDYNQSIMQKLQALDAQRPNDQAAPAAPAAPVDQAPVDANGNPVDASGNPVQDQANPGANNPV
jgi:septation ring formation regulator EzrA